MENGRNLTANQYGSVKMRDNGQEFVLLQGQSYIQKNGGFGTLAENLVKSILFGKRLTQRHIDCALRKRFVIILCL